MKKINKLYVFFLIMALLFSSHVLSDRVQAEGAKNVKMSANEVILVVGKTTNLKLLNEPQYNMIAWKSSNKKIADVTQKGKVYARKTGTTIITATVEEKEYTCKVTVKKKITLKNTYKKNSSDVKALRKIIQKQLALGAKVSTNLNDKSYKWSKSGRLTEIVWDKSQLQGNLSFAGLSALTDVECPQNQLKQLDVSKNKALIKLDCFDNQLSQLN